MPSGSSIALSITAKDGTSATLSAIEKRMAGATKQLQQAQAPFSSLTANATKLSQVTGINKIASSLGNVARSGFQAFQSVTRIVEPLAAISGAASIAGMMRLATAWADFGTQLGNTAARAGLTAEQMMGLQNAGRLAGVSADAMASGMTNLRDGMVKAVGGQAPQVVGMLQALGLSMADAKRYAGDTTKALPELLDKIRALKDPTLQAQAGTALFGSAWEQMLPLMRAGSTGLAEYTEKARKYGLMNDDSVAAANKLREAQTSLQLAVEGLGNSVAQKLAPVIGPVLQHMADWIAANRDWIATGIGDKVQEFATYLQGVNWAKIGADIQGIAHAAQAIVDAVGGIVPAAEIVVGFMGAAWLARMMLPLITVTKALLSLPGKAAVAVAEADSEMAKSRIGGGLSRNLLLGPGAIALDALTGDGSVAQPGDLGKQYPWLQSLNEMFNGTANQPSFFNGGIGRLFGFGGGGQVNTPPNGVPKTGPAFGEPPGPVKPSVFANNNPTNLAFYPGQPKLVGQNGRWGVYNNAADGIGAGFHQMLLDQQKGYTTLATEIAHRSPASDGNDPVGMTRDIARWSGLDPNAPLNLRDPDVARRFMQADIRRETGKVASWDDIDAGIKPYMDHEPSGPALSLPSNAGTAANPGNIASKATIDGNINVGLKVAAPPGTQVSAVQSGSNLAPLKVERSDVGYGNSRDG